MEVVARYAGSDAAHARSAEAPLIRWLLDNDLVDEINLLIFPVVVG